MALFHKFQGFERRPSHPIQVRSSANSLISYLRMGIAGATFLRKIGMRTSSSLTSGIVISLSYNKPYPCYNGISAIQMWMIRQKFPHHYFTMQSRPAQMALKDFDYRKYLLPPWLRPSNGFFPYNCHYICRSGSFAVIPTVILI